MARPSRPSVRFTPLLQPEIISWAQTTNSSRPTTGPAKARSTLVSRMNETWRRGRAAEALVGELQRQDRERDGDRRLPGQLGPGAQPEAALPGDLQVVVEEADQAEAGHQEQHEQRR